MILFCCSLLACGPRTPEEKRKLFERQLVKFNEKFNPEIEKDREGNLAVKWPGEPGKIMTGTQKKNSYIKKDPVQLAIPAKYKPNAYKSSRKEYVSLKIELINLTPWNENQPPIPPAAKEDIHTYSLINRLLGRSTLEEEIEYFEKWRDYKRTHSSAQIYKSSKIYNTYESWRKKAMSRAYLQTSKNYFIWTGVIQGISMGLFMVPLSTFSLYTIKPAWYADAAGLFSYGRMLGTSIGISVVTTILSREEQINWHSMGSRLNAFRQPVQHWLHAQGYSTHSARGVAQLRNVLSQQSQLAGFLDCYYAIAIAMVILIPLVLLMKSVKMNPDEAPPPGH